MICESLDNNLDVQNLIFHHTGTAVIVVARFAVRLVHFIMGDAIGSLYRDVL